MFRLEGRETITAAAVMGYDAAGKLTWADDATRAWAASMASASVKTSRAPRRAIVIVGAVVALIVLVAVGAVVAGSRSKGGHAGGTWVKVISWSGGGAGEDLRSGDPFKLAGGHQRVHISSAASGSDPAMLSVGWAMNHVSLSGGSRMLSPTGVGESDWDLHLPAGYYYLSCDTIACTWTVTVSELR